MKKNILAGVLLGIGIGFVLSSMFHIIKHEDKQMILDEKFIKSQARKLGMIDPVEYFDKSDINNKNSEESNDNEDTPNNEEGEKTNIDDDIAEKAEKSVTVEIPSGYKSEAIAKILKQKKLISSEKVFLNIINKKGLADKLRWGIYKFSDHESEEDIINRIIKGKFMKD